MSADGEIAVSVRAEGADEAAGELGGDGGGGGGGPGMGDGGGGGGGGIGKVGSILTRILGLIAFLGPIFDVLKAAGGVLTAFVAPVAVILARLLAPAMRLLLFILPIWLEFVGLIGDVIGLFQQFQNYLIGLVAEPLLNYLPSITDFLRDVRTAVQKAPQKLQNLLDTLRELPQRIGNLIPSVGGEGGLVDRGRDFLGLGGDDSGGGGTSVTIGGGLIPFVDRIMRDGSVDFP